MPKVVNIFIKYMDVIPVSRDKIIKIFLEMLKNFRNDFLPFLPMVLLTITSCQIPLVDCLNEFRNVLKRGEEVEQLSHMKGKGRIV